MDNQPEQALRALQARLGYTFMRQDTLIEALTHASHTNEEPGARSYERLEFLGDAVVELVITRRLFDDHPDWGEGRMTRTRAMIVSEPSLCDAARAIGLSDYIIMGRGTRQLGGHERPSILCDVFEALMGAIYLDGGLEEARRVILFHLEARIAYAYTHGIAGDYKTMLQEYLQRDGSVHIAYHLLSTNGPPHERIFTMALEVDGAEISQGEGTSKKTAQQEAARLALEKLAGEVPDEA